MDEVEKLKEHVKFLERFLIDRIEFLEGVLVDMSKLPPYNEQFTKYLEDGIRKNRGSLGFVPPLPE
jgi:hypothetical protein